MKAQLSCGTIIEANLREHTQIIEVTVHPTLGTKIEETAFFKDGTLRINMTVDSLVDLHQIITAIVKPVRTKSWLRSMLFGGE